MRTSRWLAVVLLVAAGCSPSTPAPNASAPASSVQPLAPTNVTDRLVNKAWRITSPSDRAPGSFYIFLANGTLVMASCVETYRLAAWRADGPSRLMITEDPGVQYPAEMSEVGERQASLRLILKSEQVDLTLAQADVPYVCPDMPR
jgi:hypothetical protein